MIRVFIADDHVLICDGLQTIINLQEDMEVVGVANDGRQAFEMVGQAQPHVILMDIQMPVLNGIESMKLIKKHHPNIIVLILTTFPEDEYIIEGLANGADGFLLKNLPAERILASIRDAMKGELMLPALIANKLSARLAASAKTDDIFSHVQSIHQDEIVLTEREKQIVLLMVEGKTNREISDQLYISEGTTKNYISVIYQKLGTSDRAKAVLLLKEMLG